MKKIIYLLGMFLLIGISKSLSAQSICPTYTFDSPPVNVLAGEVFCSEVHVNNFNFSVYSTLDILYDPAIYDTLYAENFFLPNLTSQDFATVDTGVFRMAWQSPTPVGLKIPDNFIVFQLCFQVKDDIGGNGPTTFLEELPLAVAAGCVQHTDCNQSPNGYIETLGIGGVPPYEYAWVGPNGFSSDMNNLNSLESGIYTLVISDMNGETITADFQILALEGEETFSVTYCENDCPFASPLACESSIYQEVVATGNGCDSIFYSNLTIIPTPITDIGTIGLCGQDCINIAANEYCDPGDYFVAFTSVMGCDSIVQFSISQNQADLIQSITPDTILCDPTNFQLQVIAPNAVSYAWFPSDNLSCSDCPNPITNPLFNEFYTIIVTDADGCTDEGYVSVEVPFGLDWGLFPFVNSSVCEGDTLSFEPQFPVNIIGYQWEGPNGFLSTETNPFIADVSAADAGTYSVTVTSQGNCTAVANNDVLVNESPIADAGPDMTLDCLNPTVTLDASGSTAGVTYQWTAIPNIAIDNVVNPTVFLPSTYVLVVADINGCTSTDAVEVFESTDLLQITVDVPEFCIESSFDICPTISGGSGNFSYEWSFDGIFLTDTECVNFSNFSTSNIGIYDLIVTDNLNACSNSQTIFVSPSECVWPGDTDTNKVVNNFDLLNIGLAYDSIGSIRANANLNWVGQPAENWTLTTPNGIDYKHIDTDGNGIVNADDTLAITQNWGLTHNLWAVDDRDMGTPFYVESDTFIQNETYEIPVILGEEDFPAEDVYGVAFTLVFDTSIVASNASLDFENSWLGGINSDMIAIQKTTLFPQGGRIDAGVTRIDGQNMTGYGQMGTFYITIEDIIFQAPPGGEVFDVEKELVFKIENVKMISFDGQIIDVDTSPQTSISTDTKTAFLEKHIQVFPNPTSDILTINSPNILMENVAIYNITGKRVFSNFEKGNQLVLDTSNWLSGTYFIEIQTAEGVILRKVVK